MINLKNTVFKRRGSDNVLYICVFLLVIFGIIMIGSASIGQTAIRGTTFAIKNFIKQGVYVFLGVLAMFFFARSFKKRWVGPLSTWIIYGICLLLMASCILFESVKGSNAWIRLGPVTIQPAEFMKIVVILFCAFHFGEIEQLCQIPRNISHTLKNKLQWKKLWYCFFRPVLAIGVIFLVGCLIQRDFGTSVIILFICAVMFFITPVPYYNKLKIICSIILVVAIGIFALIFTFVFKGYQLDRIYTWLNPLADINNNGWQLVNGLIAFTSSGLFGKGFMASTLKYGYIPEAYNDFISAIIFEELGLVGFMLFLVPYCIIIYKMFSYGFKIKDAKSKLILYGIGIYFFTHLFVNIGGVTGFIPMTGVPLLFVSAGGSSMLTAMIAIGIAQSIISKYNRDCLKEQI